MPQRCGGGVCAIGWSWINNKRDVEGGGYQLHSDAAVLLALREFQGRKKERGGRRKVTEERRKIEDGRILRGIERRKGARIL